MKIRKVLARRLDVPRPVRPDTRVKPRSTSRQDVPKLERHQRDDDDQPHEAPHRETRGHTAGGGLVEVVSFAQPGG
jgi:hypothetical protein